MPAFSHARLDALETLWLQVAGTRCNLSCTHCLVSASPTNRTHEPMTRQDVRARVEDGARLGVREYYFTGGEPFLHPELEAILEDTLAFGPVTVLTNGLRLDRARCARLRRLADRCDYSLDLRLSLDGPDAATNDPIRGAGTFDRVLAALRRLAHAGFDPVLTVSAAWAGAGGAAGQARLLELLEAAGLPRPRIKVLPLFRIGAEIGRGGGYDAGQTLAGVVPEPEALARLQCSSGRAVTSRGVYPCPILVNEPGARIAAELRAALGDVALDRAACWTCYAEGATCRT